LREKKENRVEKGMIDIKIKKINIKNT